MNPLEQCRMTKYHDFTDPKDGETREWANPQRARCPVWHQTPTLPRSVTTQNPQWNANMYDQWTRIHDCVAQQYNDCNDGAYERETARIKSLCGQHQTIQQQVELEEQSLGQAASATALNQLAQKPRRERPEKQARSKQFKRVNKGSHTITQIQQITSNISLSRCHFTNHCMQPWELRPMYHPAPESDRGKHAFKTRSGIPGKSNHNNKPFPLTRNNRFYYYYMRKRSITTGTEPDLQSQYLTK